MRHLLIIGTLILFSTLAQAYNCTGQITQLQQDGSGVVGMTMNGGPATVNICRIGNPTNSNTLVPISDEACQAIYATLLAARVSGIPVQFQFSDSTGSCTSTSTHPPYTWLAFYSGPWM